MLEHRRCLVCGTDFIIHTSPPTSGGCPSCGASLSESFIIRKTSGTGATPKVLGAENGVDPKRAEVKWRDDIGGWEVKAIDKQVNGDHYKSMKIQPVEFITANQLGFLEGCVIKRMCRWKAKDGIADLKKAIHEIELLIELHNDQG